MAAARKRYRKRGTERGNSICDCLSSFEWTSDYRNLREIRLTSVTPWPEEDCTELFILDVTNASKFSEKWFPYII